MITFKNSESDPSGFECTEAKIITSTNVSHFPPVVGGAAINILNGDQSSTTLLDGENIIILVKATTLEWALQIAKTIRIKSSGGLK